MTLDDHQELHENKCFNLNQNINNQVEFAVGTHTYAMQTQK